MCSINVAKRTQNSLLGGAKAKNAVLTNLGC
jgi:hypothetical protein